MPAGQPAAFPRQMRLIGIADRRRQPGERARPGAPQQRQEALKTEDALEGLRPVAEGLAEAPPQCPLAQRQLRRQPGDERLAGRRALGQKPVGRLGRAAARRPPGRPPRQAALEPLHEISDAARRIHLLRQPARLAAPYFVQGNTAVQHLDGGETQPGRGMSRSEAKADDDRPRCQRLRLGLAVRPGDAQGPA